MSAAFHPLGRRFVLATVAAVAGVAVTVSLGNWQLSRAAQKEAIHDAIAQRRAEPLLDGRSLAALPPPERTVPAAAAVPPAASPAPSADTAGAAAREALVYRRIALRGTWLPQHTVYLDNRQMDGRPGFFVVTPLQIDPGVAVLVQRGWVPRNFQDRTQLPPVETPTGPVEIEGRIAEAPSKLFSFAGGDPGQGSSRIRQNLDLADYRHETGLPLVALSVLQTGAPGEGLQRRWPEIASGVEKHYGYAFQWFGLAALIATLYVWYQLVRRFVSPRRRTRS
ncbi:SURF1 family protein [Xylophilus sp. Leaf220]|uniref:SURF1 family protein n=1 Tax=Xylophilus sp. Leaf220 TaxID=1735686 RepID=UPI0006FD99F9|nr:SURF1 family protein [Xylophilus sp. Leaf220]KQM80304.1 transmembrane cytochrome oxidase [Xylophilus sp. Leaf220]